MCPTVTFWSAGWSGPQTEASSTFGMGTVCGRGRTGGSGSVRTGGGVGAAPVTVTVSVSEASDSWRSSTNTSPGRNTTAGLVRVSNPDIAKVTE